MESLETVDSLPWILNPSIVSAKCGQNKDIVILARSPKVHSPDTVSGSYWSVGTVQVLEICEENSALCLIKVIRKA